MSVQCKSVTTDNVRVRMQEIYLDELAKRDLARKRPP